MRATINASLCLAFYHAFLLAPPTLTALSLRLSIVHGLVSVVLFAIPLLLSSGQPVLTLTVGGILNVVYHFLAATYGQTDTTQAYPRACRSQPQ